MRYRSGASCGGIGALIRRWRDQSSSLYPVQIQREGSNQKRGSHPELKWLAPWSWTSQPLQLWKINVPCLNYPICGICYSGPKYKTEMPPGSFWPGSSKVRPIAASLFHYHPGTQFVKWREENLHLSYLRRKPGELFLSILNLNYCGKKTSIGRLVFLLSSSHSSSIAIVPLSSG